MLWEASFSFEGIFGATGGKAAPWTTSLLMSPNFAVSLACFASLEEVLAAGRVLDGLAWLSPAYEKTGSALEPEEIEVHMAGG